MAADLPVSIHVAELNNSDLAQRLFKNERPSLLQLSRLAIPGVIGALEKLWYMPVTNNVKFFLLNYPGHHYTVKWKEYHEDDFKGLELAMLDGYMDVVQQIVEKEFWIVKDFFRLSTHIVIEKLRKIVMRGQSDIITYLRTSFMTWRSQLTNDKLTKYRSLIRETLHIFNLIHYFIMGFTGDIEALKLNLETINQIQANEITRGIMEGNQLTMFIELTTYSSYTSKYNFQLDLSTALQKGKLAIVEYLVKTYRHYVTPDTYDDMLKNSLIGGDVKTVNYVLKLTKLKFNIDQLASVIRGGNPAIFKRFAKQFPQQFDGALIKFGISFTLNPNLEMLSFAVEHNYHGWKILIDLAKDSYNFAIFDLVVQNAKRQDILDVLMIENERKIVAWFIVYLESSK